MIVRNGRVPLRQILSLVVGCLAIAAMNPATSTVTATAAPPVVLTGHVLPGLGQMTRIGTPPPSESLTLTIALRPTSSALHDAISQARSTKTVTPFLSTAKVAQNYGQSAATVNAVSKYFSDQGFRVLPVQPDHLSFQVVGTLTQVNGALGVDIGTYQDAKGQQFRATDRDPQLPADIASSVQAIFGLDNYPSLHPLSQSFTDTPGQFTPSDMQSAYDVNPLYTVGDTGNGQTIGIIGCDAFATSDIRSFESLYGLPQPSITQITVDDGPMNDGSPETTLDLEWSSAIAKGASLRFYGFSTFDPYSNTDACSLQGLLDAIVKVSNDNAADVISISLGACEASYGSALIASIENQLAVAANQGQGVFVATGDTGGFVDCPDSTGNLQPTIAVSYPASSAYVTAVGGTTLTVSSSGSYGSESAWGAESGDCQSSPCGSGGGISSAISEPAWQSQAGILNTNGSRGLPDVSWNADPKTGNIMFYNNIAEQGVGGTSIASPQWAGLAALANQAAGHRLGQLAPLIYSSQVQSRQTTACAAIHDVTTGNNLVYNAGPGWDLATGWGSPDAYQLARALVPNLPALATSGTSSPVSTVKPLLEITGVVPRAFLPLVPSNSC